MKPSLKRILPILLAIVVICSIAWYLFVYDREFTRDTLLSLARFAENQGNHSVSVWLYNQAYQQSEDSDSVAIELAEQFKSAGNYTKAEYTLSQAIADGGSAELYIALCKTYVEQDKLLDAVTMLDNISDSTIKAQLDVKRPAVPTTDTVPGFYSQYITVNITAESGKLYVTFDGEYPSTAGPSNAGSVQLSGGETTIYALTIGDNGLVSPLAIYGYTVGGVIEELTLTDSTFDTLIRQQLQVDADTALYTNQLWTITSLEVPEDVENYEDLKYLPYLESLTIYGSSITDLSALASLSHLTKLTLDGCYVTSGDLSVIGGLTQLQYLTLTDCNLSGIDNLSAAKKLTYLDLSNNSIRDITPLSSMTGLQQLKLSHNALTDASALSSLTALETLDLSYNSLTSVTPLASCTALQELNISNNAITSLTGMDSLKNLTVLAAGYNDLSDISVLSSCTSLISLDISNNELTNISSLSALTKLEALNFSRNQVTTLPAWHKDCALVTIDGSYNQLKTIAGLAGYQNLNNILMDYNSISSVSALTACPNLIKVSIYGNPVNDVSPLTDMSVIVNYTPKT